MIFGFRETNYDEVKRWLFVANEIQWSVKDATGGDGWKKLERGISTELEVGYRLDPSTLDPEKYRRDRIVRPAHVEAELRSVAAPENGYFGAGRFRTPSLEELRVEACGKGLKGTVRVSNVNGDVTAFLAEEENKHATFQVASQFNCLEFVGPTVTPEQGIAGYANDRTQGPACSIAAGVATAYRNYFAPVLRPDGQLQEGQTGEVQIDNLMDVHPYIGNVDKDLVKMMGGYTMANSADLAKVNKDFLYDDVKKKEIGAKLRIGLHEDVQVTSRSWGSHLIPPAQGQKVTEVFGSACAIAYNRSSSERDWEPFATMVLDASFEATLWSAVVAHARHRTAGSNRVYLTALGGGVFGNDMGWIGNAIRKAVEAVQGYDLDVRIVTYAGAPDPNFQALEKDYGAK